LNAARRKKLLAAMKLDKKVHAGEIRFVLARRIGRVEFGQRIPQKALELCLDRCSPGVFKK